MPRFVVLYHDCPPDYSRPSHWDLLFDGGDALRAWAIEQLPAGWEGIVLRTKQAGCECRDARIIAQTTALELAQHRSIYLEYEGPLTDNRGGVARVEEGRFALQADSLDIWKARVEGRSLAGVIELHRTMAHESDWQLTYRADSSTA